MIDKIIQFFFGILFFATPLIMSKSTSELFEFNKMIFIYGLTIVIAFLWFYKMVVNKKIILKKTPLDIPIIIFFVSQVVSTIFSIDRHVSIFGYYGRFNGGLFSITCYILLYYALISNKNDVEKLLKSIMVSSLLVILWAIPGHFGHDLTCLLFTGKFDNSCWDNSTLAFRPELRAFSTLGQPNWLGAYLAAAFFIGIYFLISQKLEVKSQNLKSKFKSLIWPGYLFLNFSMILMSRSRSAIGAVIVGLILFIIYYWRFIKIDFKKILIALLFITIIPIILFKTGEDKIDKFLTLSTYKNLFTIKKTVLLVPNRLAPLASPKPTAEAGNPSSSVTESFDIRTIVWEGAWTLAKRYPIFGTGVETFAYAYNFVRPIAHNLTSEWDYVYNKAHNEYFNYLATTGFVGLGSYLLFIGSFILFAFAVIPVKTGIQSVWIPASAGMTKSKNKRNSTMEQSNNETVLVICLLISWLTILITNFFGFSTTTTQLFFYLIPGLVILGRGEATTPESDSGQARMTIVQKICVFISFSVSIYLLFSIAVYYIADVNYSYGLKFIKVNDQQRAAGFFEKALKLRNEPVYMDRFSSSLAYLSALAIVQKETKIAKEIANLSDTYNRKLIQSYPNNIFYWKTRAKNMYYFFQITGKKNELEQGISALKNAQKLSPTDPKVPYSLALYYSIIYDTTKNNPEKKEWQKLSLQEIDKSIKLKSNYQEAFLLKKELLKKYNLYKVGP